MLVLAVSIIDNKKYPEINSAQSALALAVVREAVKEVLSRKSTTCVLVLSATSVAYKQAPSRNISQAIVSAVARNELERNPAQH